MPNAQKVNYLRGKDLITIGIFSAIYFVLNFICMLISGLHPLVWILMPMNIAIVTGIPFLLLCAKVQKFGAVLIMGIITGLIYYVTGQFTVILLITFGCACLLAEVARAIVVSHDDEFMHLTCDCEIRLAKGENPYGRT